MGRYEYNIRTQLQLTRKQYTIFVLSTEDKATATESTNLTYYSTYYAWTRGIQMLFIWTEVGASCHKIKMENVKLSFFFQFLNYHNIQNQPYGPSKVTE